MPASLDSEGTMRTTIGFGVLAALAMAGTPALAQPAAAAAAEVGAAHTDGFHMGLGAGIGLVSPIIFDEDILFLGPSGGSVLIPLDIAGVFRIEPDIGFFHYATNNEDGDDHKSTGVRPNLGLFGMIELSKDAMLTLGLRLGPQFVSSKSVTVISNPPDPDETITVSRSRIDFLLSPAVGGEYYFSENFSLGAETQLNFVFVGDEDVERDPATGTTTDPDDTAFYTLSNALIYARVFFL
jgi:hypothetical protein